jgi:prophage antirepressor-like protein
VSPRIHRNGKSVMPRRTECAHKSIAIRFLELQVVRDTDEMQKSNVVAQHSP